MYLLPYNLLDSKSRSYAVTDRQTDRQTGMLIDLASHTIN